MPAFATKLAAARQTKSWQLALDKFPFNLDRQDGPSLTAPNDRGREQSIKPRRLGDIIRCYNQARSMLQENAQRQQRFLARLAWQHGPRFRRVTLVNSSRLLLHLGRASVLRNVGLYCDRTTGLPVIPGSAVKGVISTWACWEGNSVRDSMTTARSVLGEVLVEVLGANPAGDVDAAHASGGVVFLTAYPQSAPHLELDIVTPHPNEGRGQIMPSPFLSLKPGTKWDFSFLAAPRQSASTSERVLEKAETWLRESLTQIGIGAKSAAGYGTFRELNEAESSADRGRFDGLISVIRQEDILVEMHPEDKAYYEFVQKTVDWPGMARDVMTKSESDKAHILRFFRSDDGKALIKAWPKNDKAKARIAALKDAGL